MAASARLSSSAHSRPIGSPARRPSYSALPQGRGRETGRSSRSRRWRNRAWCGSSSILTGHGMDDNPHLVLRALVMPIPLANGLLEFFDLLGKLAAAGREQEVNGANDDQVVKGLICACGPPIAMKNSGPEFGMRVAVCADALVAQTVEIGEHPEQSFFFLCVVQGEIARDARPDFVESFSLCCHGFLGEGGYFLKAAICSALKSLMDFKSLAQNLRPARVKQMTASVGIISERPSGVSCGRSRSSSVQRRSIAFSSS